MTGFYKYKDILKEDKEIDRHSKLKELVNKYDQIGVKADDSRDSKRIKLRAAAAKEDTDDSKGSSPSTDGSDD